MEYRTTRERCLEQIRESDTVCNGCGGELTPIETVDNSNNPTFWAGCTKCCKFTWGYPKIIFEIAKDMVLNKRFRAYTYDNMAQMPDEDDPKYPYWLSDQISGTCGIASDIIKLYNEQNKACEKA